MYTINGRDSPDPHKDKSEFDSVAKGNTWCSGDQHAGSEQVVIRTAASSARDIFFINLLISKCGRNVYLLTRVILRFKAVKKPRIGCENDKPSCSHSF
jgi:hypothetical protein